jgi:transcriptional regulator with XRE-family HTH domain
LASCGICCLLCRLIDKEKMEDRLQRKSQSKSLKDKLKNSIEEIPQDAANEADGARLGREIRKLRKARGRSLMDMASFIGRSVSFCSQLERGGASPSIADLRKISDLLDVSLGWFFSHEQAPSEEEGRIVRSSARRRLGTINTGLQEDLLSPDIGGSFETFLTTFGPRAEAKDFKTRNTEEEGYIISGTFELWIGDKHFTLNAGDSFRIVREPFRWLNPTDSEVSVVWVIAPPIY